jgi:hypothetical protein
VRTRAGNPRFFRAFALTSAKLKKRGSAKKKSKGKICLWRRGGSLYVCIYVLLYVCMYLRMNVCGDVNMWGRMYICGDVCMYVGMYVCVCEYILYIDTRG